MLFPFMKNHGVLGLNARSLLYIKPFNPKKAVAFADDKIKTKAFLSARGIPTAKLYARIETRRQLQSFDFSSLPDRCVIKPNFGFGGEGIIILKGRKNGKFLDQGKRPISTLELREHIEDILDGKFSVNGQSDSAFFEQILEVDESLAPLRPAGLPDIRIVVFNLVPVMAMLRLPTSESGGKANVHLGGIGIGIDIAKGITTHAAQYHHMIDHLPHGSPVSGIQIPQWDEMLLISSRIQYITNIGYLAVDLTLDKDLGPVLLEVNARAGLMVQVANLAPLQSRLKRVEGLKVSSPEKGVRIAQELFGEKVNRRDREEKNKTVLGPREIIEITGDGLSIEATAAVVPEEDTSIFAPDLIAELKLQKALEPIQGSENTYRVKFSLGDKKIQTIIKQENIRIPDVRALIGKRDLGSFLIDPSRTSLLKAKGLVRTDLRAVDKLLALIDEDLPLLKVLRPLNLQEEIQRIKADRNYNPVFLQYESAVDLDEIEASLRKIETNDSPLGIILRKKRRELLLKVDVLRSRGDAVRFTSASLALYGTPSPALIGFAEKHIASRKASALSDQDEVLESSKAKIRFEKSLLAYGLHDWQVVIKENLISDCAVGGRRIFLRKHALFTEEHIDSLIAHEIETHVLTSENGAAQPYRIFRRGFANYLDTQEGLAIYNQIRVLSPHHEKRYLHAKNVLAVAYAMEHSFSELRAYLQNELGFSEDKAIMKAIDCKRGFSRTEEAGSFTRGLVYFRGFRAIEQFVQGGGDLRRLYVGKVAIEDLQHYEQIPDIKAPSLLPEWLRTPGISKKDVKQKKKKRR